MNKNSEQNDEINLKENKEKLRAKLKAKRERRNGNSSKPSEPLFNESEPDIMKMMGNINKILQQNPKMVQQISKCVSSVLGNKDTMEALTEQIKNELQDQTLDNNNDGEDAEASSK